MCAAIGVIINDDDDDDDDIKAAYLVHSAAF